jgi:hypothetical protein
VRFAGDDELDEHPRAPGLGVEVKAKLKCLRLRRSRRSASYRVIVRVI